MADELDEHGLPIWGAPERNKGPILEQLVRVLPSPGGTFLEIGSATGQHLAHFAAHLPHYRFLPSDYDPTHLRTLERRRVVLGLANVEAPLALDVTESVWPLGEVDVVYSANMVHIAPWEAAVGLFDGAARHLRHGGLLLTYGPYKLAGRHTAESNERFDASLRERNAAWGVRDVDDLSELASARRIELVESTAMPANNFFLVWQKR
jgi:SAM-dependent methyltransferase